jgi:hypothetical protein
MEQELNQFNSLFQDVRESADKPQLGNAKRFCGFLVAFPLAMRRAMSQIPKVA